MKAGKVTLSIYNVLGRRVRVLVDEFQAASPKYALQWDGRDDLGRELASGLYFAVLRNPGFSKSIKILKLK